MIAKRDQALEATTQDNNCNKQETHQCSEICWRGKNLNIQAHSFLASVETEYWN